MIIPRKYCDYLIGAFIFFCASFYISGQTFGDAQHAYFKLATLGLFALSLYLAPLRNLKNGYINTFLVLSIMSFLMNKDSRQIAIAPIVDIVLVVMVFYILLNHLENAQVIYNSIIAVIVINFIMVMLQFFKIDPLCLDDAGLSNTHLVGIFGYPMNLGAYMSVVIPYVWQKNKWFGIMAGILVIASKSWAAILCAIVGMVVYFWYQNKRMLIISLVILGLIGGTIGGIAYSKMSPVRQEVIHQKIILRINTQYPLIKVALSKPYFGYGLGTFKYIVLQVPELRMCLPSAITGSPSIGVIDVTWNNFLGCALELGLVSVFIFLGIIRKTFREFLKCPKTSENVALFASLSTIPLGALFHSYMDYFNIGIICLALYVVWEIKQKEQI